MVKTKDTYSYSGWLQSDFIIKRSISIVLHYLVGILLIYAFLIVLILLFSFLFNFFIL